MVRVVATARSAMVVSSALVSAAVRRIQRICEIRGGESRPVCVGYKLATTPLLRGGGWPRCRGALSRGRVTRMRSSRDTLRLLFSLRVPVGPRDYLRWGFGLMVAKYLVDATVIWVVAHKIWSPID